MLLKKILSVLNKSGAVRIEGKKKPIPTKNKLLSKKKKLPLKARKGHAETVEPKSLNLNDLDLSKNGTTKIRQSDLELLQLKNKKKKLIASVKSKKSLTGSTKQREIKTVAGRVKMNTRNKAVNEKVKAKQQRKNWLAWKMYTYRIFNALLKGEIDKRDPNLNSDSMQIGYREVFTKKTVSSFIVLTYFPRELPSGFLSNIIRDLKDQDYWSQVQLSMFNKKYTADFNSTSTISKLENWIRRVGNSQIDTAVGVDGEEYIHDEVADNDRRRFGRLIQSYYKLRRNIGHAHESTITLKVSAYEKEELLSAMELISSSLTEYRVNHYTVKSTILDFIRAFSTVSQIKTVSTDVTNRILMTTRDIVMMLPFLQGKVGEKGIWFGIDIFSGSSVWLDIMSTPKAKNILVLGETGSGKSFLVSILLFFHRALGHNIFVHDHKGNEFRAFARKGKGLVISMTPAQSSYIMTWAIQFEDLLTEEDILASYSESYTISEVEFLTLTQPDPHEKKDYKNIFSDFHKFVHSIKEIHMDKIESYSFSHDITPEYLYESYLKFMDSPSIRATYSHKMLADIQISLHRYWSPDGARNILYKRPVDITAVRRSKIVCFDFGMAEKTRDSIPENEEKLKKIFMNITSSIFINYKKKLGEYTVKVVEEIQSADEDILRFTSADITEGRAKNLINYVLGNASGSLELNNQYSKAIVQNMNIRLIGKLAKSAREFFINEYGLHSSSDILKNIAKGEAKYNHAFLLDCQITNPPSYAVVTGVTTKRVEQSEFFRTVDYEKHEVKL